MPAESRSVVVRLSFEATRAIADAKAAGLAFEKAFDGVDGKIGVTDTRMRDLEVSTRGVGDAFDDTSSKANRLGKEIDTVSGRLGLLVEAGLLAGPALAPIGAVGTAALVGLTAAAGFAVGGIGALVLGAQGVGDAFKAVNTAALEPTAANLAAARSEMNALDPAAQQLVSRLFELRDVGSDLQDRAAAGVLPGVQTALDAVIDRAPLARRLIGTFADATGDAIGRAGESLAGNEYRDFFQYLNQEAPDSIASTTTVLGNLAHAGTEVFEAFSPLSRDLLDGLVRGTEALDSAATGLEGSDGMAAFIDYVRQNGPQVVDTAGAIGAALVDIATAAAPLGGPVLAGIEAVADLVGAVAGSDLGTPFVAGTAAVLAYQRAVTLAQGAQRRLLGSTGGAAGAAAAGSGGLGDFLGTTELRKSLPTLQQAGTYVYRLGQSADQATPKTLAARDAVRSFGREAAGSNLAKGAAGIAALTVATSGAADGLGLSNTAALGLAGTMAGPVGAAAGILVGGFLDIRATADGVQDSMRELDRVFGSSGATVDDLFSKLAASRDTLKATRDDLSDISGVGDFFGDALAATNLQASGIGGKNFLEEGAGDERARAADLRDLAGALYEVNGQLGGLPVTAGVSADGLGNTYENLDRMREIATQAGPALDALGLSVNDLGGDPDNIAAVVEKMRQLDSSDGRIDAVAAAVAGLDNQLLSTVDSASAFSAALDGALGPGLNLSAATDQYRAGLRNLAGALDGNNKSLRGNTAASDQNRAAIRNQVGNITDLLTAQAASGASSEKLSGNLRRQRSALLDAGAAAGVSRGDMRRYIDTLGLTPKLVKTLIQANTGEATRSVNQLKAAIDGIRDKTVTIHTIRREDTARAGDVRRPRRRRPRRRRR